MIKKLIHAFNPFNGTPFKTSLLLAIVCVGLSSAIWTLLPYAEAGDNAPSNSPVSCEPVEAEV